LGNTFFPWRLIEFSVVNPDRDSGRVTLITRYGVNKVLLIHPFGPLDPHYTVSKISTHLANHIKAVQESGHPVIWVCDPMHGK
jgi:3-deoxy-7-phosphoheptulonate synthase